MSEQREVLNPSGSAISTEQALNLDTANAETRSQRKARLVRILDRGMVADRLNIQLPDGMHGEWVANDKSEIYRLQLLGFKVDTEYAKQHALHDQGDDTAVVGDAIFMTCDRETKEILDEIRRENFEALNGKPGQMHGAQREEKDAVAKLQKIGMPIVEESRERSARKADLEAVLQRNAEATASTASGGAHIIPASATTNIPQPQPKGNIIR